LRRIVERSATYPAKRYNSEEAARAKISTSGPSEHLPETPLGHTALHDQLRAHALETFGEEAKALHWLNRPSHLWGGKTPADVLKTQPQEVERELVRIDHGIFI
jgi:Protein of unknown function (DUF2384)